MTANSLKVTAEAVIILNAEGINYLANAMQETTEVLYREAPKYTLDTTGLLIPTTLI